MRVVAVGDNCVDVYYKQNRFYPTGNAVDFAINLCQQDVEVALVSILGNDVFGASIKNVLQRAGIDISHLWQGEKPSAAAQMNLVNGDRVHEVFTGNVLQDFELREEDKQFVRGFDIVYSEKWSRIGRYIKDLRQDNQLWVHDFSKRVDDPTNEDILPWLDYAFFSCPGRSPEVEQFLLDTQKKMGNGVVIAMLGEEGSLAYDGAAFTVQQAKQVDVVNTVGAGDSYVSGFVKGLCLGEGLAECMARGTAVATRIIQMFEPYAL